jgi:hypothetical protein
MAKSRRRKRKSSRQVLGSLPFVGKIRCPSDFPLNRDLGARCRRLTLSLEVNAPRAPTPADLALMHT